MRMRIRMRIRMNWVDVVGVDVYSPTFGEGVWVTRRASFTPLPVKFTCSSLSSCSRAGRKQPSGEG